MRPLDDLLEVEDPRWPDVQSWIDSATNVVEALPPESDDVRSAALVATQVSTRSPMGAIVYETGGLLVDHGWLRILGSGCPRFPRSLPEWNQTCGTMTDDSPPPFLLVADDAVGGFFAVNGGVLGDDPGALYYFAPDSLDWEPIGIVYTEFIHWALTGDLATYYADLRWADWQSDVQSLPPDRTFSFYPFLWAEAESLQSRQRSSVPVSESFHLQFDFARQLDGRPTQHGR